jgi:hypothetical protein
MPKSETKCHWVEIQLFKLMTTENTEETEGYFEK